MPPGKESAMRSQIIKNILLPSLALVLLCLLLSLLAAPSPPASAGQGPLSEEGGEGASVQDASPAAPQGDFDSSFTLTLQDGDETRQVTMGEYLQGAVAAEMPASFEEEALRAQAVALRTYALRKALAGPSDSHPEADICSDSACCAAWRSRDALEEGWGENFEANMERISRAVSDTDGVCVAYQGDLAQTVFHSSSAGMTAGSGEIWSDLPYLTSVESPESQEDVPGYVQSVTVSLGDFSETILASYPEADLSGEPESWIGEPVLTGSGRVDTLPIGGVDVPGTALRSLFGLRSTAVTVDFTDESVIFTTTGYGHGVGMSQYGANTMAREGSGWREILAWYYPGTELAYAGDMAG